MYIIILLNIIVLIFAYLARYPKYSNFLGYGFFLLSIVVSLRYDYGNDYFAYYDIFQYSNIFSHDGDIEWGWFYLCKLFYPLGFMFMTFVVTNFSQYQIYKFIKCSLQPSNYLFAAFIYLFTANYMVLGLSMMRQFLVMSIAVGSIRYIIDRNFFKFLCLVGVCFFIHKSSLLLLPLYFTTYLKDLFKVKGFFIVFLIIFVLLFLIGENIITYVVEKMIGGDIDYVGYLLDNNEGKIGKRMMIIYGVFSLLIFKYYDTFNDEQKIISLIVLMSYMLLPFVYYAAMFFRLRLLYSVFEICCYPIVISKIHNKFVKVSITSILVLSTLFDFYQFFFNDIYHQYFINFSFVFDAPKLI